MPIRYKLTTQSLRTYNDTIWTPGEWRETSGAGELCGPGWLHCYSDPMLAMLMNPLHANISIPRLWTCEVEGARREDHGRKEGWTRMRLVSELSVVAPTVGQSVRFGILCAMDVVSCGTWRAWAAGWLSGEDRTYASAYYAAADAAAAAAYAAAAAAAAAYAAYAAYYAYGADLVSAAHEAMLYE